MRAWEFMNEAQWVLGKGTNLHTINSVKKRERARQASFDRRRDLLPIMYGGRAELERIEIEKARLELAQQKAELVKAQAEANNETRDTISRMAHAGRKRRKKDQEMIEDMATRALGRRKKSMPKPGR